MFTVSIGCNYVPDVEKVEKEVEEDGIYSQANSIVGNTIVDSRILRYLTLVI